MEAGGADLTRLAGGAAGSRYVEGIVGGFEFDIVGIDILGLDMITC
jgi:hypothetical protein